MNNKIDKLNDEDLSKEINLRSSVSINDINDNKIQIK